MSRPRSLSLAFSAILVLVGAFVWDPWSTQNQSDGDESAEGAALARQIHDESPARGILRAPVAIDSEIPQQAPESSGVRLLAGEGPAIGATVNLYDIATGQLAYTAVADEAGYVQLPVELPQDVVWTAGCRLKGVPWSGIGNSLASELAGQSLDLNAWKSGICVLAMTRTGPIPPTRVVFGGEIDRVEMSTNGKGVAFHQPDSSGQCVVLVGPNSSRLYSGTVPLEVGSPVVLVVAAGEATLEIALDSRYEELDVQGIEVRLTPVNVDRPGPVFRAETDFQGLATFGPIPVGRYQYSIGYRPDNPLPHAPVIGDVVVREGHQRIDLELLPSPRIHLTVDDPALQGHVPLAVRLRGAEGVLFGGGFVYQAGSGPGPVEFAVPVGTVEIFVTSPCAGWGTAELVLLPGETRDCHIQLAWGGDCPPARIRLDDRLLEKARYVTIVDESGAIAWLHEIGGLEVVGSWGSKLPEGTAADTRPIHERFTETFVPGLKTGVYRIVVSSKYAVLREQEIQHFRDGTYIVHEGDS